MNVTRESLAAAIASLTIACGSATVGGPDPLPVAPVQVAVASAESAASATTEPALQAEPEAAPQLRLDDRATPTGYNVALTLAPEKETFTGTVEIELTLNRDLDTLWLHAKDITIDEATIMVGDAAVAAQRLPTSNADFLGFGFGQTVAKGATKMQISYRGKIAKDSYAGIFRQQENDRWYLYTQFEATAARQAFPCFDEPTFKVPWRLAITVKDDMHALSNTPVVSENKDPAAGTKTLHFAKTKPLPSYLVAFAVGPFDIVEAGTAGRDKVPVRVIAPHGKGKQTAYAAKTIPKLVAILEEYFDMAYPYQKLDNIAVPSFLGAMENPGLITYSSSILLAEPGKETVSFQRRHTSVAAHEIAHHWFGDLVTLAWWDDLWLNESFASWMAARVVNSYKPQWDETIEAVARRDGTMRSDTLITARQIRQPIKTQHDITAAFDGITYGKGAAVLWMFEQWIGEDKFRQGVRDYIRKHSWQVSNADDFLSAIGAVSQPAVTTAFRTFLEQPGLPLVTLDMSCKKGEPPRVSLKQERFLPAGSKGNPDAQLWKIPVCIKYGRGKKAKEQCTLFSDRQMTMELRHANSCPRWISGNADAKGYYRVNYGKGLLKQLIAKGRKSLGVHENVAIIGDMSALTATGKLQIGEALATLPTLLKDKNRHITSSAVAIAAGIDQKLVPNKLWPNYGRFIRKHFGKQARKLGWKQAATDSENRKLMRSRLLSLVAGKGQDAVLRREAVQLANTWLKTGRGIDDEMIGLVLRTAARESAPAMREQMYAAAKKTDDARTRRALLSAMGMFTDKESVVKNMELFLTDEFQLREGGSLLQGPMADAKSRPVAYEFVKANYDRVIKKLPSFARSFIMMVPAAFCDTKYRDDAKKFFGPKAKELMGGPQRLAQAIEAIELCTAYRETQEASIRRFLRRY